MRNDILILKYGEVVMKGLNRSYFDSLIIRRVKQLLAECDGSFKLDYSQSTLMIQGDDDADMEDAAERMKRVFGIAAVCRAWQCEKSLEAIQATVAEHIDELIGDAQPRRGFLRPP